MKRISEAKADVLPSEIDRGASLVLIADSIIDSARVENDFIKLTNGSGSGFIPDSETVVTGKKSKQIEA